MAIAPDKEMRERAKREKLYIIQISVDGKYLKRGGWALTGPFPKEMADELHELYMKWAKEGKL
jgi:hypothetical protein